MNEWTKETIEAFQRHIPRDNFKKVDKQEDSEVMKEFKRLLNESLQSLEKEPEWGYERNDKSE